MVYLNKADQATHRVVTLLILAPSPTDRLFPNITDQVITAFRRACKAVNIADFRFHDLRHATASWLRMKVADIHTVAQLLGHKDLRMAALYQHLVRNSQRFSWSFGRSFRGAALPRRYRPKTIRGDINCKLLSVWRPKAFQFGTRLLVG
jgi:hypothetical protein